MNSYILTRRWFDFAFEHKEAKAYHTALFCWIIELNNRLGWKAEFGLPTQDTVEGLSIGSKNTYLNTLRDLAKWKFIEIVQESKNQYQSCVIKICHAKNDTAQGTALDTALIQHDIRHAYGTVSSTISSTVSSIDTIDKPINQETNKQLVVEVYSAAREKKNEEAIDEFCNRAEQPEEEPSEKSSAQKEFPSWEMAIGQVSQFALWRNVIEHHKLDDQQRTDHFKLFYEMKEDNYRIRYPTHKEMVENFYHWVKIQQNRESLQKLKEHAVTHSKTNDGTATRLNRVGHQDKRDGLRALKNQSSEFLRQANADYSEDYPNG